MASKLLKLRTPKRRSSAGRPPVDEGYLAHQFMRLYIAWDRGDDVQAAFKAVPKDAIQAVKDQVELDAMCSGEMFGHKERNNGQ